MTGFPIRLLRIESDIRMMVMVDGVAAGETGGGNVCLPACAKRLLLAFYPLENATRRTYLPFFRLLDLSQELPALQYGNDGCELFLLPQDTMLLRAKPPYAHTGRDETPFLFSTLEFSSLGRGYRAIAYFDRTAAFAIEDASKRVLFAYALEDVPESVRLFAHMIGGAQYLLAECLYPNEKLLLAIRVGEEITLLFFEPFLEYECSAEALILRKETGDPLGRGLESRRTGKRLEICETRPVSLTQASGCSDADKARSFALAVLHRDEPHASSLLEPELSAAVSFSDLCGYFGDFTDVFFADNLCVSLQYPIHANTWLVRTFLLTFRDGLIANITE